jgi:hypothetical protein
MSKKISEAEAEKLWEQLRAAIPPAGALDNPDDDLVPEVATGNGRHYFVAITLKGRGAWLPPEHARWFAEDLFTAAYQADAKMTDEARREMYPPDAEDDEDDDDDEPQPEPPSRLRFTGGEVRTERVPFRLTEPDES